MEIQKNNYPLIYYVIQGKSTTQENKFFNKEFLDLNPLIAREKAFDFFEYNVKLQKKIKIDASNEAELTIKSEFILNDSNKFIVSIKEQIPDENGVGLYLVVNNTIGFAHKTEQSEERFLLHSENCFNYEMVLEIKKSLVREFGLYKYLDFRTTKYERIVNSQFDIKSQHTIGNILILKTPFDFKSANFLEFNNNLYNRKILYFLNNISHQKSAFLNDLNWHNIRIQVSSFLNTGNGYIFLGNIKNFNKVTSVFNGKILEEINASLEENISKYFPDHLRVFSFEFITINNALIVIIVFKTYFFLPSFYNNEANNIFYYRDKNGINSMNQTSNIVYYLSNQKIKYNQNIIDIL
jgi:hypothetical protein